MCLMTFTLEASMPRAFNYLLEHCSERQIWGFMEKESVPSSLIFEEKSIGKILLKIAPPVMMAQLIQAMYNIVDSYFVGKFSSDGLTALSVIYPLQLIITAVAVGTGVGVNTQMSRDLARGNRRRANGMAGLGSVLAFVSWILFAVLSHFIMEPYARISVESPLGYEYAMCYGRIVCIGSIGVFMEGMWSKVHQASGNMRLPMIAEMAGAFTNIILDPVFIFGIGPVAPMGIAGAAYATVIGQCVAALITISGLRRPPELRLFKVYARRIYDLGFPSIFMQLLYTVYILALNIILAGFSDSAVAVLGLYYKVQSFFFIPLYGLQTCIVPFLSYTYAKGKYRRCIKILNGSILISLVFMTAGFLSFEFIPEKLLMIFSDDTGVLNVGVPAFKIIGLSFFPAVVSLMPPVFFQAIGKAKPSILLSITRQLFCLIPIFWLLSKLGLVYSWMSFPLSETITGIVSLVLLHKQIQEWKYYESDVPEDKNRSVEMKLITAILSKYDSDDVCKALREGGFYFTKLASSGGFLSSGNTTVLIGTEANKVKKCMSIIRSNCSRRVEQTSTTIPTGHGTVLKQSDVVVGGATIFVTDVDEFEKI